MPDTDRPRLRSDLRIDGATLRLVRLPLVTPFTIATGTLTEKVFPLLTLRADGIEGHAEGVMDPLPDYLEETVAGAMDFLSTVLLPQVVGHSFANPESLARKLAPWRANHMAKATVEMAFWDLWAKWLDLPLGPQMGQCCGGRVEVSLARARAADLAALRESEAKAAAGRPQVLIFGAGHTGRALARCLSLLPPSMTLCYDIIGEEASAPSPMH